jgi:YesN/AraC family two-component response regulator
MSRRLLLVDDEPAIVQTLSVILQKHDYQVTSANNVADALQAISKHKFDILVTDLNIGEPGDGFTVVSALRRTQPDALALIITGFPAFDKALQAIREQVDDFLVKPIHPRELVEAIEKTVRTRRVHVPVNAKRISDVVREGKAQIMTKWLARMRRILKHTPQEKLSDEEVLNHLGPMIDELCRRVEHPRKGIHEAAKEAAVQHGEVRRRQAFEAVFLLCESTALRQTVLSVIHHSLMVLNLSYLFVDLALMSESLDEQLQVAMTAYLGGSSGHK